MNRIRASDPIDYIKDVVQSSMYTPEFDMIHRKKASGHIGQNVVNIAKKKMKTIVQKL